MTEEEIKKNLGRGKDLRGQKFNKLQPLYPLKERNKKRQVIWHCVCDCGNEKNVSSNDLVTNHVKSCGCLFENNLLGKHFGRLEVVSKTDKRKNGLILWLCKCECGNSCEVRSSQLLDGTTKSCGCIRSEKSSQRIKLNLKNRIFGKLTVLEDTKKKKYNETLWKCQCSCGSICYVITNHLTSGQVLSCGCLKSKGEEKIEQLLLNNEIKFEKQKTFETCRFKDTNALSRFDFYLPDYNCIIEYDGEQHFKYTNSGWNTKENFIKTQEHDIYKNQWCKNNNIFIIRIPYTHFNNICLEDLLLNTTKFLIKQ